MQQFIVSGVGRSGTTAAALALNFHPHAFCAIEHVVHSDNHAGLLRPPFPIVNAPGRPKNRELFAAKDASALRAFGNKWPQYFLRWDGVLSELDSPRAIVMVRDLASVMVSWDGHIEAGHLPPAMASAYAPFDMGEMIRVAIESPFAADTLFVSYDAVFYSDRCVEIYALMLQHLGLAITPEAESAFRRTYDNNPVIARKRRLRIPAYDALIESAGLDSFVAEIRERGACLANDTTGASAVAAFLANGEEIARRFAALLASGHEAARSEPGRSRQFNLRAHDPRSLLARVSRVHTHG